MKQREIKFRAWDKRNVVMIFASFFGVKMVWVGNNDHKFMDMSELMQYTGLKDRNNKEIFEGYIVYAFENQTLENSAGTGEIVFRNGSYMLDTENIINRLNPTAGIWSELLWYSSYEIIGNVYENPELLKQK